MSIFSNANEQFRNAHFSSALELYIDLYLTNPEFSPYRSGITNTLAKMGLRDHEIDSYMLRLRSSSNDAKQAEAVHPGSIDKLSGELQTFVIITPVLNGEKYLDKTIESVLSQRGDFYIDYFVKDGGSCDATVSILESWSRRILLGEVPLNCKGLRFRFESARDDGMYDAIAYGFEKVQFQRRDILSYINSDDYFLNDAFEITRNIFSQLPDTQWVCGQMCVVDENGRVLKTPSFPLSYSQQDILEGLHDGRELYFIQQEGVFWLGELNELAGGINRRLKLAGDYDLWTRFAKYAELIAVSCPLAHFRSRTGQLSSELGKYNEELEQIRQCRDIVADENVNNPKSATGRLWLGRKAPHGGKTQNPGPVCFLNDDGSIKEVAYIQRGWYEW